MNKIVNSIVKIMFFSLTSISIFSSDSTEEFVPNGTLTISSDWAGNAGKYKTSSSNSPINLEYQFTENLSVSGEWYRSLNGYSFNDNFDSENFYNQYDNNYNYYNFTLNYDINNLFNSEINMTNEFTFINYKYFENYYGAEGTYSGSDTSYIWYRPYFDFSSYITKYEYFENSEFKIAPGFMYGYDEENSDNNFNSYYLGLFTSWNLPQNVSLNINLFGMKENYKNDFRLIDNDGNIVEDAFYYGVIANLSYTNQLHQFTDKLSLDFNFLTGLDPLIWSDKNTNFTLPEWIFNDQAQYTEPTKYAKNYSKTLYSLFATPELMLNYIPTETTTFSVYIRAKYGNQVWGGATKEYKWMPQAGVSFAVTF